MMKRWIIKVTICSALLIGFVLVKWISPPENSGGIRGGLIDIGAGLLIALSPFAVIYLLILLSKKPKS
jgi:hypothetical protein